MRRTSLPQPHEQRNVEELLAKLSKMKPISAKSAPIALGKSETRAVPQRGHESFSRHDKLVEPTTGELKVPVQAKLFFHESGMHPRALHGYVYLRRTQH